MNYRRYFIPNSIIFATIVTAKRRRILLENIYIIQNAISYVKQNHKFKMIAMCIMQDHIHILMKPEDIAKYPIIIRNFKSYFSRNIDIINIKDYSETDNNKKHKAKDIWQQRYYEHNIRDEKDLNKHIDYIHYNSMKHYNITPKDWEYSTFKEFVKNGYYEQDWCNFEDRNNINNMDFE